MTSPVEHLKSLVGIPSVSRISNRAVIDYAAAALHQARWQTREAHYTDDAGVEKINLIAAPPGQDVSESAAELVFFCHTDTVPYSPEWREATTPRVRDGLLHGCGACDVKGFLACLLAAVAEMEPSKLGAGLRIALTADEEIGCLGAARLLASEAIRPRRVIVGEPTSLTPARAGKGYCLAEVTVFGREAHSALPQEGRSAIYRAARLITAIEELGKELAKEPHSFFSPEFTSLNIGTIRGGTAKNVIPGQCCFELEWRPIPGWRRDSTFVGSILALGEELRRSDPDFRCELEVVRQQRGFETAADAQLVRKMEALTGRPATSIPFASEANLLGGVAEETVVFGPGNMQTAHSDRECVPIAELEEAVAILKQLMAGNS